MKDYQYRILNVCIGAAALAPFHWLMPYDKMEMASLKYLLYSVLTAAIAGGLGVYILKRKVMGSALWTTSGFVLAIVLRLIWDVIQDPTSHNLFPVEVFIIILYSFPSSLLGARIAFNFRE